MYRFRATGHPLFWGPEGVIPAASVWTGARGWVAAGKRAGWHAGQGLVYDHAASHAALQLAVAARWMGWRVVAPTDAQDDDVCLPVRWELPVPAGRRPVRQAHALPDLAPRGGRWALVGPWDHAAMLDRGLSRALACAHEVVWHEARGGVAEWLADVHADAVLCHPDWSACVG